MAFLNEIRSHRYRTWKCLTLCFIFVGLGIVCSFPGPTILDLKIAVNSTMDQIALIIPIDASGHMFGSVIGAFALSYLDHQVIIMHSLMVMSITFLMIPYCRTLLSIYLTLIFNGLSTGFLINAGNVWVIHMWGKENTPFMQLLHFAYGLGCFMGPIIAEPFLLQDRDMKATHHHLRIQYGYAIGAAINLLCWVVFVFTYLMHQRNKPHPTRERAISRSMSNEATSGQSSKDSIQKNVTAKDSLSSTNLPNTPPASSLAQLLPGQMPINKCTRRWIVFVSALFVHVTYGLELSFGILLPVYAVKSPLALSKSTASFLTSLYWACFTFPKLLAAACSSRVSARKLLWIELFIICLANVFLIPFGTNCEWALWVGTALIGVGVSSVFPCLLGHLEQLFPVSSKVTSLFTTFSCIGEFILPMVVGMYIETHPSIFLYIVALYSFLSVIFYVILLLIEWKAKCQSQQLLKHIQSPPFAITSVISEKSSQTSNIC